MADNWLYLWGVSKAVRPKTRICMEFIGRGWGGGNTCRRKESETQEVRGVLLNQLSEWATGAPSHRDPQETVQTVFRTSRPGGEEACCPAPAMTVCGGQDGSSASP